MAKAKAKGGELLTTIGLTKKTKSYLDNIAMETGQSYEIIVRRILAKAGLMSKGYGLA